jgi:small subunit ribosomal protein S6
MALYESVFIARQDISAQQADALADTFTELVVQNGGKVEKRETWGLRGLAYKIKKNRKGHYMMLNLDAPPDAVHEMERQMRLNEDVLRYLTIRVDELEEGPSAVMRSRHSDDRGRPRDRDDRPRDRDDRPRAAAETPAAENPAEIPAEIPVEEIAEPENPVEVPSEVSVAGNEDTDKGDEK